MAGLQVIPPCMSIYCSTRSWRHEHAYDTIIRLVQASNKPVTILLTAPLTNIVLALALAKAPKIKKY